MSEFKLNTRLVIEKVYSIVIADITSIKNALRIRNEILYKLFEIAITDAIALSNAYTNITSCTMTN